MDYIPTDPPEICGVLLLPSPYLFPHNAVPLHIFEPRYQEMIDDALDSHWMFAVGTLTCEEGDDLGSCAHLIGTLGSIHNSRQLEDGRSHLTLQGRHLVKFEEWIPGRSYPQARISVLEREPLKEKEAPSVQALLLDSVQTCIKNLPQSIQEEIFDDLEGIKEVTQLIDCVSQHFIDCEEARLSLLADRCDRSRAKTLLKHLHG